MLPFACSNKIKTILEKCERVLKNGNDSWKSRPSFEKWELALKNETEAWLKWELVLNKMRKTLQFENESRF